MDEVEKMIIEKKQIGWEIVFFLMHILVFKLLGLLMYPFTILIREIVHYMLNPKALSQSSRNMIRGKR